MLQAHALEVVLGGSRVLAGVDLTIGPGEFLGVLGPNGSGKTTLLRSLHGWIRPRSGRVTLDGADLARLSPRQRALRIAVVGQDAPPPVVMRVQDLVLLGRSPHRADWQGWRRSDREAAADALERVGAAHLYARRLDELSGGERQRVFLARALAQGSDHVLLDEPTNHLDVRYQHEILDLTRTLGRSVLVVLHDVNLAARYCDRIVLMQHGRIVGDGPPAQICTPELITGVYGVDAEQVDHRGVPQLLIRAARTSTADTQAPRTPAPARASSLDHESSEEEPWQPSAGIATGVPAGERPDRGPDGHGDPRTPVVT